MRKEGGLVYWIDLVFCFWKRSSRYQLKLLCYFSHRYLSFLLSCDLLLFLYRTIILNEATSISVRFIPVLIRPF
jgi:hypothetical protein